MCLAVTLPSLAAADPWAALREPGAFALMRHALAPGAGDPAEFRLGDCTTQRNLDGHRDLLDAGSHDEVTQLIIADAQTSGGLVFGVDPAHTVEVLAKLEATDHRAAHIGVVTEGDSGVTLT